MKKLLILLLLIYSSNFCLGQGLWIDICVGGSYTLPTYGPPYSGGTWTSTNTAVATIGSGVVIGVSPGTAQINYSLLPSLTYFRVNSTPTSIVGDTTVCFGTSSALSSGPSGGNWSSSNTSVATVNSTGIVTSIGPGTAVIRYTIYPSCIAKSTFIVDPSPILSPGSSLSLCVGNSTAISTNISGGTWSSSSTTVATVDASSGIVAAVAPGVSTITYTIPSGCYSLVSVSVSHVPTAISGNVPFCEGSTLTLSNSNPGGTWSSSNTAIASVTSGIVTGYTAGTAVISYILSASCYSVITGSVNPSPAAIVGPASVCEGGSISLSNTMPGGIWSSSNTSVAGIVLGTGSLTGISAGTSSITYAMSTGCAVQKTITVFTTPLPIIGLGTVCSGSTITLNNATSGGTWSSSNTSIATVTSGVVTGYSAGVISISYTLSTGCHSTATIIVYSSPATIAGPATVCESGSISLSNVLSGGVWSSSNTMVAGIVPGSGMLTGISAGSATITYAMPTGCAVYVTKTVLAIPLSITGPAGVCNGSSIALSNATSGGVWGSANTSIAIISPTGGVITGAGTGTSSISYTLSNGCYVTSAVSVHPNPAPIVGSIPVCEGSSIILSDVSTGGIWSSANTAVASVGSSSGIVIGGVAGTTSITYMLSTGCYETTVISVDPVPAVISGASVVCVGATILLSNATIDGTWSSGNTLVNTVSTSGVVSGVTSGKASIIYTLPTGCASMLTVTVNYTPVAIIAPDSICLSSKVTLADATPTGAWSSSNTTAIIIGSSTGVVSPMAAGVSVITYMLPSGCYVSASIRVVPAPEAISGVATLCEGNTSLFANPVTGGVWSSDNKAIATVSTSGIVSGLFAGTAVISYTLPPGCYSVATVAVKPAPEPIIGSSAICAGFVTILNEAVAGGAWTSSNTSIATIDSKTGLVKGLVPGNVIITYAIANGCFVTKDVKVSPPCGIGGVGIKEIGTAHSVSLYPNPAYDELIIKAEAGAYTSYVITNQLGQVVLRNTITAEQTSVNVKALRSGMYHVSLKGDGEITVMKFIKQ